MDPIIILAIPRSGSSMVAGLFHSHGIWAGLCRQGNEFNEKGFFENIDIKKVLLKYHGRITAPKEYDPRFTDEVKPLLPDIPYLIKHSAVYWVAWREFTPKWVFVRRNVDSCLKSCKKVGFLGKEPLKQIERHHEAMDYVKKLHGGENIYSDELIAGDYSSLERAFNYCGIKIDLEIVKGFIDPRLWHY